jgi:PAS domain S-box-containing protein
LGIGCDKNIKGVMRGKKELGGRSILAKLMVAMMLLSIISVAIILSVALNEQKQIIESNLIEENKRLAEVAARSFEAGYIAHSLPFRTLSQINASEDVLFWWIVNPEGEIYLADNPEMCGKKVSSLPIEAGKTVVKDYVYGGQDIKLLIQPLAIGEPGKVEALCIGISLKSVREATNKMILNGMLYFFAITGLACLLSLFLARRFTEPITQLVEGTKAISRGEFDHRVAIKTGDEIEGLSDSFNEMAQRVKNAIEEEKAARREAENIMDTMINSLVVVNADGRIEKANKAAFDLLGYSEGELIGMPFDKIISKDAGIELEKLMKEAAEAVVNFETTYIAKDGREIPVNFSASVMRDDEGRLKGILCDAGDITERKNAEEELRKYMAELKRFNRLAVDRELRMIELKKEVNLLCEQLGEKPPYNLSFVDKKITNEELRIRNRK